LGNSQIGYTLYTWGNDAFDVRTDPRILAAAFTPGTIPDPDPDPDPDPALLTRLVKVETDVASLTAALQDTLTRTTALESKLIAIRNVL